MKAFVEHIFTGPTTTVYDTGKTYIGTGNFIKQFTGSTSNDKYISTFKISTCRPMEATVAVSSYYPWVHSWSDSIDWVFTIEGASSTIRRFVLIEYNKITNEFNLKGFVQISSRGGNLTSRGFRGYVYTHTTGDVSVDGTSVTGNETTWVNERISSGSRIGFGSTNPNEITTWYEISSIDSNTGITLYNSAGNITSGTSYVIEEIRLYAVMSSATATNSGLFIVKGLNYSDFIPNGTTINNATTIDNVKACYWLKDNTVVTMTTAWGLGYEEPNSGGTEHFAYCMNGAVTANNYHCYKYNLRASLNSLSDGISTEAYLYRTGNISSSLTGTIIITNNGRVLTLNHGGGNGISCLYFVTTTRVYRCPVNDITDGSTTYIADGMVVVPPGGTTTFIPASITNIEHADMTDMIIMAGSTSTRSYVSKYNTVSQPVDVTFLANSTQYDQSTADSNAPAHPTTNATVMSLYIKNGFLYLIRQSTSATLNQAYCLPFNAHRLWADDTGEYIITPKLNIPAKRVYRVYINSKSQIGDSTFGVPTEDFDLLYRVSGIDDNSGTWNEVSSDGDLSSIGNCSEIQFKIRFKVLGTFCLSARIYGLSVIYEDLQTDSHYTPSVNKSNVVNRVISYQQSSLWDNDIPDLNIKLYNAATGSLVLDDYVSTSLYGTWEYSTDGEVWNNWSVSANNIGNYIRYTATTLPSGIVVRALLTQ